MACKLLRFADQNWFQIFVRVPGRTVTVLIDPTKPLDDVREKVLDKTGLSRGPRKGQISIRALSLRGKTLNLDRSAYDYNIQRECTLDVVLRVTNQKPKQVVMLRGSHDAHEQPVSEWIESGDVGQLLSLCQQAANAERDAAGCPPNAFAAIRLADRFRRATDFGRYYADGTTPIMKAIEAPAVLEVHMRAGLDVALHE